MNTWDCLEIPLPKIIPPLFEKALVIPPWINYSVVVNNGFLTLLFLQQVLVGIPSSWRNSWPAIFLRPSFLPLLDFLKIQCAIIHTDYSFLCSNWTIFGQWESHWTGIIVLLTSSLLISEHFLIFWYNKVFQVQLVLSFT